MILRPDGALLTVALVAGLFWYTARGKLGLRRAVTAAALCLIIGLLPLVPWTVRNWRTFHILQPLAPRHTNDPGEWVNLGFYRWLRTWSVEYATTSDTFWQMGESQLDPDALTALATDSAEEKAQTLRLYAEYNQGGGMSAALDGKFNALAEERIRRNPLRYYLWVPALRVLDMTLRPRTEEFDLDVDWWRWSKHRLESWQALALGLLNLAFVGFAGWGFLRRQVPLAGMLGGYLLMRCLLLATLENPEPRYTIEFFPILIVAIAAAFYGLERKTAKPQSRFPVEKIESSESSRFSRKEYA
jgi:hypothetical protein